MKAVTKTMFIDEIVRRLAVERPKRYPCGKLRKYTHAKALLERLKNNEIPSVYETTAYFGTGARFVREWECGCFACAEHVQEGHVNCFVPTPDALALEDAGLIRREYIYDGWFWIVVD